MNFFYRHSSRLNMDLTAADYAGHTLTRVGTEKVVVSPLIRYRRQYLPDGFVEFHF